MVDKHNKICLLAKVFCLVLILSTSIGCAGARETDQVAFVLAVGFDKLDDNQLEVTLTIANTLSFTSTGGGGGEKAEPIVTVSAKAPAFFSSSNLFNSFISRQLTFIHLKSIIIGEEAAKKGIEKILTLTRFREARGNSSLYICKGKAKDFLMNNKPKLETSPAKQFELIENTSKTLGLFPVTTVNDFYFTLKNLRSSPIVSLVGISKKGESEEVRRLQQVALEDPLKEPYYAGMIPETGGGKAEFLGTAVFREDKMVGILTGGETRAMLLLQGKLSSGYYSIRDPKHDNFNVSLGLRQARKPEIIVKRDPEGVKIQQTVFLEGDFLSIESGENYEEPKYKRQFEQNFSRQIEKQASELIAKTKEQGYGDIFHYDRYYRKELATWEEWQDLNWEEIYDQAEINIICKTNIRRPGLMRKTEPVLKE